MAATEAVRIRQLRVRGPEAAREQAVRALEQAPWPARPGGEVLILRRLQLAARAEDLAAAAADQARALAARAVDGWSPATAEAPAVRFASRAELLACLVRDLLAGRARHLWFWAGWRELFDLAPAAAAARALAREPLELAPALSALGRSAPAWQRFWAELPEAETRELLAAVQRETGWPVAESASEPDAAQATPPAPDVPGRPAATALTRLPRPFPNPEAAPARLAALLLAWTTQPHRLGQPGALSWLDALARQLSGAQVTSAPARPASQTSRPAGADTPAAGPARAAPVTSGPARPGPDGMRSVATGPATPAQTPARPASAQGTHGPAESDPAAVAAARGLAPGGADRRAEPPAEAQAPAAEPGLLPRGLRETTAEHPPSPPQATWNFVTAQGGLFHLLNFLRIGALQRRLVADPAPLAGWRWLLAAGRGLGLDADPPLARFLAAQLDLDDPGELDWLPPLGCEQALYRLGRRRFGAALWNPHLLRLDALVWADRSHLEVHCRMADVRLAVRRAGLDVDPGWLPWLGRVVRFHYDDPPDLGPRP